jgi:VanZ family protein
MKWHYLIIIVLGILFFVGGPGYYSSQVVKDIWDTGHVVFFCTLIIVLLKTSLLKKKDTWIHLCFISILCLVAGMLIEVIQLNVGRSFEIKDLWNDLLGGYLGFLFVLILKKNSKMWIMISSSFLILLILFIVLRPVCFSIEDEFIIENQFPVLADFETTHELGRWDTNLAKLHYEYKFVRQGRSAMQINFFPGKYPDITLRVFHNNWVGYNALHFSVYSTDKYPVTINLKIYDSQHISNGYNFSDRFNRELILRSGWNDFDIPVKDILEAPHDRLMDLANIVSVSLFLDHLNDSMTIYFDGLRLSYN